MDSINCCEKQIEKIFLSLDLPATDATYQHFCNAIRKAAEKLSQKIITKTIVRVGMQSVKASTHVPAFSREISRVLLQRIYSQDLTENGGIDGLKQFRESTFYTLAFSIRVSHWTNYPWITEYCDNTPRLRDFISKTSIRPVGMGLLRTVWVKCNRLRIGIRRFYLSMNKWSLAT